MTYIHLVEKMQQEQDKLMPAIKEFIQAGDMPEDFARAVAGIEQWDGIAAVDLGPAEVAEHAPDIDPVSAFSNALFTYKGMFSEKDQETIQLYREHAEELYRMVKAGNIKSA